MGKQVEQFHGSDLEKIEEIYGIKKEEIVSFAANVNPLGLSEGLCDYLKRNMNAITSYPDRHYVSLRKAIAAYCDVDFKNVIVGNGSTELISLFIKSFQPQKALILAPTYSEYEHEVTLCGGKAMYFPLNPNNNFIFEEDILIPLLDDSLDLLVLCNPNNPTSSAVTTAQMKKVLTACQQKKITVMTDETYIEFAEDYDNVTSVALTKEFDNLIVIRGVSKFYASPGLRLGYAITSSTSYIEAINTMQDPWTINSLAAKAGEFMFTDIEYQAATKRFISAERTRIVERLNAIPSLNVYPPTANFVLIKILREDISATVVFEVAIREKMMLRNCNSFPFLDDSYFRFCFMSQEENERLLCCLERIFM